MIVVPDIGGTHSTWKNQEQFTYRGHSLELCYQTEPPHGDFIYSLTVLTGRTGHRLPLWVFGRNLFFFGPSCLLAESVPAGRISDLKSAVIELSRPRYALLDSWYHQPQMTDRGLLLTRRHDAAPLLLTPAAPLVWENFEIEGACL